MSEMEYFRMEEDAEIGKFIAGIAKAIFDAHDAETMGQLQRTLYKYTDAGIAISFELHNEIPEPDSTEAYIGNEPTPNRFVYCGDERAYTIKAPWLAVRAIGVSSIVEGSDAEVPVQWLDLMQYCDDEKYEGDLADIAKIAVKDFDAICDEVNDEACALWDEAHRDDDPDTIT
jgi:hypothetical protein